MAALVRKESLSMQAKLISVELLKEPKQCGFCNLDICLNSTVILRQMFLSEGWCDVYFRKCLALTALTCFDLSSYILLNNVCMI